MKQAPLPTKGELLSLRLMIFIGTVSLLCFMYCLLDADNIMHPLLYRMFMVAVIFASLRILHEWYHYLCITIPKPAEGNKQFTVDIFTTFCPGEPYDMIVETLKAMQAVKYPHTSWLCDEADDPYLKEVCRQLGVRHVTRPDRRDAKAGNINNALRYASGELCVILDPDHIPEPDFLDPVVPYFNDERVGYVQIVQAYHNIGDSLIAKGAAQQTFQFYGPMMMSMNRYGTVLAIGANCTFRRLALDDIGGHAAGLAEDMHTSMQLHAEGWLSVYLPVVLTYGRAPSTLSAYYKQQLKWARGTFELLVTTYPRLFKKFTWAQRFHYGTIPFHYFSGIIFLINFLVPILSLVLGVIPLRMDLVEFTLLGLPFICTTLAVRHFVQRWVMGSGERGNHVLGGFLLIGTWWVHILGLFYTLIRRKVPYIPTPKDDHEKSNWILNIPNIIMAVCTLAAILYGLHIEWNPYTWIMSGIAGLNFLVLVFNIAISREKDFLRWKEEFRLLRKGFVYYRFARQHFWTFRHTIYAGLRIFAFPFIAFISFLTLYLFGNAKRISFTPLSENTRQQVFYTGLFSPSQQEGATSMANVFKFQAGSGSHISIISLYCPWGDEERCNLPEPLIQSIYMNGSVPLITWEPWASGFRFSAGYDDLKQDKKVFRYITEGVFDNYIERFALQLKALNKPVYLRFAHEPDNPAYPWSQAGDNTPEDFRNGWRYVHDLFIRHRVYNVIWVWNPWKPGAAERYFPGTAYVDWIGMTGLDYGRLNNDGKMYSFRQLYQPFHYKYLYRSGLPVMVAEGGSTLLEGRQQQWLEEAGKAVLNEFREIKAFVLFNAGMDRNVPLNDEGLSTINWQQNDPGNFFRAMKRMPVGKAVPVKPLHYIRIPAGEAKTEGTGWADTICGINYQKGANWFRNLHTLTRKVVIRDLMEMRSIGMNTLRRTGPGVYDRNIFAAAAITGMKVHYGFWLPSVTDVYKDADKFTAQADEILGHVKRLKDEEAISAWYITNTAFPLLQFRFHKPDYLYQQQEYVAWLKSLVMKIKKEDPGRPVIIDVEAGEDVADLTQYLHDEIPQADAFGLVLPPDRGRPAQLAAVTAPHFISSVSVPEYSRMKDFRKGICISSWQDQGALNHLSFDGLLDHAGRYKPDFYRLQDLWHRGVKPEKLPPVDILRPAIATKENSRLVYRALVRYGESWKLAANAGAGLRYEWSLVRQDRSGTAVMMKRLGEGPEITVEIPFNFSAYSLHLAAVRGNSVVTAKVSLNTPL